MSQSDYVLRCITLLRPHAKFAAYSHSTEFIDATADLGDGFHYVNLYDEQIDSNVISSPRGLIMIHNTYLSSFAYNLFLCWLYGYSGTGTEATQRQAALDGLLAHNFKKFFAEQLLHAHNNIAARALLLETLLFEQTCMVPVFAEKARDVTLAQQAERATDLMSSVLSFHELGHYFLDTKPGTWESVAASEYAPVIAACERAWASYPSVFVTECRCDTMAVISCVQQHQASHELLFGLRTLAFAFAAYAVLCSLTRSAQATAEARQQEPLDEVDFTNLIAFHREHEITLGLDQDFVVHARLVIALCHQLATQQGLTLVGTDTPFPLPATILEDLLPYLDRVLACDDPNARPMSNLVAEALHGHEEGMNYLYLRSKTFQTNRPEGLRL